MSADPQANRLLKGAAFAVLAFLVLPSLIVVPISFGDTHEMVFPPPSLSLDLYRQYFGDPQWLAATWLSVRVAIWTTLISLLLGIPAAYGLVRGRFPGKRLVAMFLLSPIMVPSVVIALGLYIYFVRIGLSHGELRLVLGLTVVTMPFVIVTATAGLQNVDPNLEKAATVMGAGPFTVLFRVTLPLLKPAIVGGSLFAFLMSFDEVVIAWFITRAGYETLPIKMFSSIQWEISPVLAAVSSLLMLFSVVVCVLVVVTRRNEPQQ
ncbi:MAG: ABC transporter permease [Nitratireductor sp.]|nr:ABC transporter permease [Nitratireductor sp.]